MAGESVFKKSGLNAENGGKGTSSRWFIWRKALASFVLATYYTEMWSAPLKASFISKLPEVIPGQLVALTDRDLTALATAIAPYYATGVCTLLAAATVAICCKYFSK